MKGQFDQFHSHAKGSCHTLAKDFVRATFQNHFFKSRDRKLQEIISSICLFRNNSQFQGTGGQRVRVKIIKEKIETVF